MTRDDATDAGWEFLGNPETWGHRARKHFGRKGWIEEVGNSSDDLLELLEAREARMVVRPLRVSHTAGSPTPGAMGFVEDATSDGWVESISYPRPRVGAE